MTMVTIHGNPTVNGVPYKQVNGEWVRDEDAYRKICEYEREEQARKDELIWALRTRILTDEETAEVQQRGADLLLRFHGGCSGSYSEGELERWFSDLLADQFRLRAIQAENLRKA